MPVVGQRIHLGHGHTAVQVGAHVVRFGGRGIVHITADVAVVVFCGNLAHGHAAGVGGHVCPGAVGVDDFVHVFGPQVVLGLAFAVFAVGVDKEHLLALCSPRLVEHQDASRYAGAIKQVAGQADHGFQVTLVYKVPACLALFTTPE